MKKILVVGVIALAGLGFVGCGSSPDEPGSPRHGYLKTNDGQTVYCVYLGYGMSCDWANAE